MRPDWKGIYPALTTPFTPGGKTDLPAFQLQIRRQLAAGVSGLVVAGTLGEASVLDDDEKTDLLRTAIEAAEGRVPVIMNIAEGSTARAVGMALQAQEAGADGLMLLPAMRYRTDYRETVTWFREIAAATALPVMVYNNPVDYRTEVTLDMFAELEDCATIQAVKESTRDNANITRMRNRFGSRYKILSGVDTLAFEAFCLGADGWVAGLVAAFPGESVALYRLVQSGSLGEARRLHEWFLPLLELDIHPKLVQYIKLVQELTGCGSERVRAPRMPVTAEERQVISRLVEEALATKPVIHV